MCVVPALACDSPKYVGDVWVVEEVDRLVRHGGNVQLGVFDTLAGAQAFSSNVKCDPTCTISISKIAYYTTKWSDTNEE